MSNNNDAKFFQWLAGDRQGEVVIFDKIESEGQDVYIVFKDGSRMNENFISPLNETNIKGKIMAEIDHPNNCWEFKEEWIGRIEERWEWQDETNHDIPKVCVQPFVPGRRVIKPVPPKKTSSHFGTVSNVPAMLYSEKLVDQTKVNTGDPVYILMSKAKKIDTDINMGMVISLPSKSLYNIAKDSFENGGEKFVNYIVDDLTEDEIKSALKIAIKEMYEDIEKLNITIQP